MQADQLVQGVKRVEECADQAIAALRAGSAPSDVSQCVGQLHQQARDAKHSAEGQQQQGQVDQNALTQQVMQIEETADRAMQAVRQAGDSVDPQLQQAVQRAHAEASSLKKQVQMG